VSISTLVVLVVKADERKMRLHGEHILINKDELSPTNTMALSLYK